ncbi:hypothetical protein BDK51DRAFT_37287 [Blyttiomyces helicus]|uniref:DUF6818 domain-containing protein n=1 Tax=Blyttiomyces helicus TaxID=388810 RepID=A0A4P9WMK0_9FUNG|nr:hypothetical protein BDK51DRAFT_37287 [Blyttiomyces helicus]|eukprot:RKO93455.1 hypothetical protein BDK51DRAFT_37287 [Blyttiomyces helicus]
MTPSGNKSDKSHKGSGKKKPAPLPKDEKTKEKKPKSSHKRGKGFRNEEKNCLESQQVSMPSAVSSTAGLLDVVNTHLSLGAVGWEATADEYNKTLLRPYNEQSAEALKSKFGALKNTLKPTGDDTTHENQDEEHDEEDSDDHIEEGSLHPKQGKNGKSGDELNEAVTDGRQSARVSKVLLLLQVLGFKQPILLNYLHLGARLPSEELAQTSKDLWRSSSIDLSSETAKSLRISQAVVTQTQDTLNDLPNGLQTASRQSAQLEREDMAAEERPYLRYDALGLLKAKSDTRSIHVERYHSGPEKMHFAKTRSKRCGDYKEQYLKKAPMPKRELKKFQKQHPPDPSEHVPELQTVTTTRKVRLGPELIGKVKR